MGLLGLFMFLVLGILAGWLLRRHPRFIALNRWLTRVCIGILLFLMGGKLALHRALLTQDLRVLGLALASSLLVAALLFAVFLLVPGRRRASHGAPVDHAAGEVRHELGAVLLNGAWLLAGFLAVWSLPSPLAERLPLDTLVDGLLGLLLMVIGIDLGTEVAHLDLRALAPHLLLVPVANLALTLGAGCLFALLTRFTVKEGLLVTAGMGWYTLSSILIGKQGLVLLSLLAFIHNVGRELIAILTAPLAARISPYLPIYLGGATAMDVMLPFVQASSGRAYTLVSFYSGLVCSLAVPPLVNLLLSL